MRQLDQKGELDDHLRPVTRKEDSDNEEEDDDRRQEKRRAHAGTEKAINYYENKVKSVFCTIRLQCFIGELPSEGV